MHVISLLSKDHLEGLGGLRNLKLLNSSSLDFYSFARIISACSIMAIINAIMYDPIPF